MAQEATATSTSTITNQAAAIRQSAGDKALAELRTNELDRLLALHPTRAVLECLAMRARYGDYDPLDQPFLLLLAALCEPNPTNYPSRGEWVIGREGAKLRDALCLDAFRDALLALKEGGCIDYMHLSGSSDIEPLEYYSFRPLFQVALRRFADEAPPTGR